MINQAMQFCRAFEQEIPGYFDLLTAGERPTMYGLETGNA
jgi:hypothetical protein